MNKNIVKDSPKKYINTPIAIHVELQYSHIPNGLVICIQNFDF